MSPWQRRPENRRSGTMPALARATAPTSGRMSRGKTMTDQTYTQTSPDRAYRSAVPRPEESRLDPANGKFAAGKAVPSDRLIGQRYLLRARLGRWRLGDVYEALDERSWALGMERRVAILLLDERLVARRHFADEFERGAAALRAVSHSNVVGLLESGRDRNRYFFVVELLEGASLRFVLDDVTALPVDETVAIVRAVGDALQYLHAKAMVHGNLRPESVLVTYDYEVKLLDFAPSNWLLLALDEAEDAEPPAQAAPDIRDDVYGLACLTYELLAGKHPFNANTPPEALRAGLEPMAIDGLSPKQWQALAHGLALQRENRTPTVARFLGEFGVTGTERLRATVSGVEASRPAPALPAPWPVGIVTTERFTPSRARSPATVGRLLSILFVAALGAVTFANHDRLRDGAAELMAAVDAKYRDVFVARAGKPTNDPVAARPPDVTAAAGDGTVPEPAQPVGRDSTEAPQTAASGAGEPAAPEPRFIFARPVATVSEGRVAARIVVQRSGNTAGQASVVWWTSQDTAIAGVDYADLGLRVEKFAQGEQSRAVFVSLVNDTVAEPTKSFNVYLGRDDPGASHLEPHSGMRVDIVDDD